MFELKAIISVLFSFNWLLFSEPEKKPIWLKD